MCFVLTVSLRNSWLYKFIYLLPQNIRYYLCIQLPHLSLGWKIYPLYLCWFNILLLYLSFSSAENYRQSTLDVLNAKLNGLQGVPGSQESNVNYVENSWIYNFCLNCRGEEPFEAWEPPFWQKICPYPLCPSFRTFSRLVSLTAIGRWLKIYPLISSNDVLI